MYCLVRKCYEFKKCRKCIIWSGSFLNVGSLEMYYLVRKYYECKECGKCIIWSRSVMNVRSVKNVLSGQEVF